MFSVCSIFVRIAAILYDAVNQRISWESHGPVAPVRLMVRATVNRFRSKIHQTDRKHTSEAPSVDSTVSLWSLTRQTSTQSSAERVYPTRSPHDIP